LVGEVWIHGDTRASVRVALEECFYNEARRERDFETMKKARLVCRLLPAFVVMLGIALSSKEARALGPVDIEIGAKAGYGAAPGGASINPLGAGIGARAGIQLFGLYAGLNLVNYFGSGDNLGGTYHALQYGGEIGYGFKISILTLRPQVGLGNITFSDSTLSTSSGSFYLEPGVTALLTFGLLFIGADVNALVVTAEPPVGQPGGLVLNTSTQTGLTVHGQIGVVF
jgi:hypothetical protein